MNAQLSTIKRFSTFTGLTLVLIALVFFVNTGVASAKVAGLNEGFLAGEGRDQIKAGFVYGGPHVVDTGGVGLKNLQIIGNGGGLGKIREPELLKIGEGGGGGFFVDTSEAFYLHALKLGGEVNSAIEMGWKASQGR